MSTAIIFYSEHHGNTRKLLDAIAEKNDVTLIDVTKVQQADLSGYDRIGLASGIYYGSYAKQVLAFAQKCLPEGKNVFLIYTQGAKKGDFLKTIRQVVEAKKCTLIGSYWCQGFDTFGPFKLVGGVARNHPTAEEISAAVKFYEELPQQ